MTREELKEHCEKQVRMCEILARSKDVKPCGKIYEEHKLILELLEQEPKTGHWIPSHIPESILDECSECGFSCGTFTFNYCPNCGCRMIKP